MEQYEYVGDGILKRPALVTIDEVKLKEEKLRSFNEDGKNVVSEFLDSEARKLGYDNIISARSYSGYPNEFQTDSQKFIKLSSLCWSISYAIIDEIKSGKRETITKEELISLLPGFDSITL